MLAHGLVGTGPDLPVVAAPSSRVAGVSDETVEVERRLFAMGTSFALLLEVTDRAAGLAASERALLALQAVETRLSTWSDASELAHLNRAPVATPVGISAALAADLGRARELAFRTQGAFDPGVGALVTAWGLRTGGGERPSDAVLARLAAAPGIEALELESGPNGWTARRGHADLVLEEGAFGKGVGLDAALDVLRAEPAVLRATLDLGGQLATWTRPGSHAEGDGGPGLAYGLAHPTEREHAVLRFEVRSGSCATSGNGERGIVVDGERLGHLLDPRTGRPAPDFGSLTVWAPDATTADALSTGLYVLGPDAALDFAERNAGIEVLVLETNGTTLHARASDGIVDRLTILDPGVLLTKKENP